MTTATFTQEDYKLIIDALWKRQRAFIAGDKMFRHYEYLITQMEGERDASLS